MIRYESAQEFLDANRAALLERESEYNLLLGLSARLAHDPSDEAMFLGCEPGQALRTSPIRPLVVSHLGENAVEALVGELAGTRLAGIVGPKETTAAFARRWPAPAHLHMAQLVYEARTITLPPDDGGAMVAATAAEFDRVLSWCERFAIDCGLEEAKDPERIRQMAERVKGDIVFWKNRDGDFVSMAGSSRGTPNGATIAYVYTPPELRRHGYASLVVGHLSRHLLEAGRSFCCLYTDLANPTSNSIYAQLGYEVVGESSHWVFDA
ncbi:MAG: GNAT family N-acetyltransferase [Planctomycetota bacterium]|jgi:predicted GNAT family acetyltransferase